MEIIENLKKQKKFLDLNEQSFIFNKKILIQKRIKKINTFYSNYNNNITNNLKNRKNNRLKQCSSYNGLRHLSIQNENNQIILNSKKIYNNSPSKTLNSFKENNNN